MNPTLGLDDISANEKLSFRAQPYLNDNLSGNVMKLSYIAPRNCED